MIYAWETSWTSTHEYNRDESFIPFFLFFFMCDNLEKYLWLWKRLIIIIKQEEAKRREEFFSIFFFLFSFSFLSSYLHICLDCCVVFFFLRAFILYTSYCELMCVVGANKRPKLVFIETTSSLFVTQNKMNLI